MTDRTPKDIIAAARRPERSLDLCLRGDLQAEWETLERRLAEATRSGAGSLDGDDRVSLAEQMEVLRSEMQDSVLTMRLRALRRTDYRDLEAKHPPRQEPDAKAVKQAEADEDDDKAAEFEQVAGAARRDKQAGVNTDTFYPSLLRACVVDPDLDDDDWDGLVDAVTDRQFEELAMTALALNKGEVSVPFSPTASRLTAASEPS